jgi:hypothetical protein
VNAASQLMFQLSPGPWEELRDGDPRAAALFDRHYSRIPKAIGKLLIVGPGQKVVLMTPCLRALFAWRVSQSKDPTAEFGDVNCAIFRNEGAGLASELILAAEASAIAKWGPRRLYTYVSRKKVRSRNPGYCFLMAGWRRCGLTKTRRLLILEKQP